MGKCSEPTNVRAGGQACPIRYQCAGCPHFESDPAVTEDQVVLIKSCLRLQLTHQIRLATFMAISQSRYLIGLSDIFLRPTG